MAKLILLTLSIVFLSFNASAQTDKESVIQADQQLNLLIMQHNAAKAASLYAEEFILTTSSGTVKLKKDMLAEIASPLVVLDINETYNVTVRVLESTAVLTGILHQKGIYKEKAFDVKLNVTDTWVKTADGWKLLSGHATLLPSN